MKINQMRTEILGETTLLHGLESLHDDDAHVHVPLGAVGEAAGLPWAEFAPRRASDALVPAYVC